MANRLIFSGGVGEFTISSSISTKELKTNDAVTIKLVISGTGNLKLVNTPEVAFPKDFEVYDPKIDNKFTLTREGLSGNKVIEYLAIPRHAGNFTIPPVEFSYFDLKSNSYKTIKNRSLQPKSGKRCRKCRSSYCRLYQQGRFESIGTRHPLHQNGGN